MTETPLDERGAFQKAFGEAMFNWAQLEMSLSVWFQIITAMRDGPLMAINVFYSGKSFTSRSDMLSAAVARSKMADDWKEFVRAANSKAAAYNETRNKLAHGLYHWNGETSYLQDGNRFWDANGITFEKLQCVVKNFERLQYIIHHAMIDYNHQRQPEERLLQLAYTPSDPCSKELSQKQKGRLQQLQAARRKKGK